MFSNNKFRKNTWKINIHFESCFVNPTRPLLTLWLTPHRAVVNSSQGIILCAKNDFKPLSDSNRDISRIFQRFPCCFLRWAHSEILPGGCQENFLQHLRTFTFSIFWKMSRLHRCLKFSFRGTPSIFHIVIWTNVHRWCVLLYHGVGTRDQFLCAGKGQDADGIFKKPESSQMRRWGLGNWVFAMTTIKLLIIAKARKAWIGS